MAYDDELPTRLRVERAKRDLSQTEAADGAGIPQPTLSRYESGERTPTLQSLAALAEFYQVSLDYLAGRAS